MSTDLPTFSDVVLPSTEREEWRYSRIGDLDLSRWRPAVAADATTSIVDLPVPDDATSLSVVATVHGRVVSAEVADSGVAISWGDAADTSLVGSVVADDDAGIAVLRDAHAEPIVVSVPESTDGGLVVVIHDCTDAAVAAFPRLFVDVAQDGRLEVVEIFRSPQGSSTLSFPCTELRVARDARLRHNSIQILGDSSWQIGRLASTVDQGGKVACGTASFGGDYARLRIDTELAGRGAHGELVAAYFGDGSQLLDFRTYQDHVARDTTSNLLFKGALGQKAASVYTGLIKIRPDARGARAFQTNRNLKLSDEAWAESVPNLEIENNEVQCSHASTMSPVDAEQRFYLESRGVPTDRADRLIVRGFFDEVIESLGLCSAHESIVRDAVDDCVERSMEDAS